MNNHIGFKPERSHRHSQISATDPNVEEYWFVCRKWFDKSAGDKQFVRELLPTDPDGNPLSNQQGKISINYYKNLKTKYFYFYSFRINLYRTCFYW